MSTELQMLVWAAALALAQILIVIAGALSTVALPLLVGNREGMGDQPGWVGRGQRAHRNMLESLVPFAALVLVAHVAGRENAMTALGAQIFLGARIAYAAVYLAGIPYLRTLVWIVALSGMSLILLQLI